MKKDFSKEIDEYYNDLLDKELDEMKKVLTEGAISVNHLSIYANPGKSVYVYDPNVVVENVHRLVTREDLQTT